MQESKGKRPESANVFYVAPDGNDGWSGLSAGPRPEGTDGPFATLERAREAVRQARTSQHAPAPVTVYLGGGTYRRSEPFVLTPQDSGAPGAPVTWAACPGERPVLSGGVPISGWRETDAGVWSVELPAVRDGKWYFRQLFLRGQRRFRPRHPSTTLLKVEDAPAGSPGSWAANLDEKMARDEWRRRAFKYAQGDIRPEWAVTPDVELVLLCFWMAARFRIAGMDELTRTISFTGKTFRPCTWSFGYYLENLPEELARQPGTWHLDRRTGILRYHPLPGEDLDRLEAVAPATEQLVRLEGDVECGRWVEHVVLRGIGFQHTEWALPPEGYAFVQAELTPSAAIEGTGVRHCRFEGLALEHLGAWGMGLGRACQDNTIEGCVIRDVGAGCLKLGESRNADRDEDEACRQVVTDCRFLDGSHTHLGSPAVWIGQSGANRIAHNEISGQFMWGVSAGWNWGYFPLNRSRDNIIEYNHIHDLGTGTLGTHGALYCLGIQPGTVLRSNYIHHVYSNEFWSAGEGIILDNGCSGILIENNVVHDAVAGGWGCNFNCFGNVVINNILAYGTKFQLTRYGDPPAGEAQPNGEVFARNIIIWAEGPLFNEKDWWAFNTLWNCNVYWCEGGAEPSFMKYSLQQWREKGLDRESLVADPLFVDASKRDFRLRPDSPALRLGFRPIDLSMAGPRANLAGES